MKNAGLKIYTATFLMLFSVVFGLTATANAAVKPQLFSKSANGDNANSDSRNFSVSADGRYVVFHSAATNLISGITDTNNGTDVYSARHENRHDSLPELRLGGKSDFDRQQLFV